jgi:hypothetical protein
MAQLPSLLVNAVTTFDGKALAKGQKTVASFAKNVTRSLGLAFGTAGVIAFGKASVKAFADDEKAATRLARTVDNLGLGFENARISQFIADLEKAANVADDVLRPAFSSLLTTTGSVSKSQKLLALSLDIAAGSGEDIATVAADLSAAYVGNTKGLAKYRLGLTKAELAGKSFNEIQDLLNKQFAGQNAARLDTYEGKVAALGVAFGNLQETVGQGLVDSFAILAGDGGIAGATDAMDKFGETARDVLTGTASYVDKILDKFKGTSSGGVDFLGLIPILGGYLGKGGVVEKLAQEGRRVTGRDKQYGGVYADKYNAQKEAADAKARAKAEADAAKRAKEILALTKKQQIAEKNKLALNKAAAVFDTTRISLAAALKATYDKETRLRLEALMAIEEDNGDLALKKISELAALQKNNDLAKLAGVKEISDSTLLAINTQLLAELKAINDSEMAEADKELLREEAFKKYNAAITAAGELAAKEQYSERVQIQLTEIARLASMSNTTSALKTEVLLRESAELSMIGRVAKAQADADAARLKALQDYLALLNKGGAGTPGTPDTGGGNRGGGGPGSVQPASFASVKAKEAADAVDYFSSSVTDAFQTIDDSGAFNALVNSFAGGSITSLNAGSLKGSEGSISNFTTTGAFDRDVKVEVTINTAVGDPEAIARVIEDVLNQSTYRGTAVNRGAGNYTVA